jgi:hypothetical protein
MLKYTYQVIGGPHELFSTLIVKDNPRGSGSRVQWRPDTFNKDELLQLCRTSAVLSYFIVDSTEEYHTPSIVRDYTHNMLGTVVVLQMLSAFTTGCNVIIRVSEGDVFPEDGDDPKEYMYRERELKAVVEIWDVDHKYKGGIQYVTTGYYKDAKNINYLIQEISKQPIKSLEMDDSGFIDPDSNEDFHSDRDEEMTKDEYFRLNPNLRIVNVNPKLQRM